MDEAIKDIYVRKLAKVFIRNGKRYQKKYMVSLKARQIIQQYTRIKNGNN